MYECVVKQITMNVYIMNECVHSLKLFLLRGLCGSYHHVVLHGVCTYIYRMLLSQTHIGPDSQGLPDPLRQI